MKAIKVLAVQSFFDISIQYTGSIDNAFTIAFANNRAVSDKLIIDESIMIPLNLILSNQVLQYYKARNIVPATGIVKQKKKNIVYGFPYGFPINL